MSCSVVSAAEWEHMANMMPPTTQQTHAKKEAREKRVRKLSQQRPRLQSEEQALRPKQEDGQQREHVVDEEVDED
jgi:hypothetical protein